MIRQLANFYSSNGCWLEFQPEQAQQSQTLNRKIMFKKTKVGMARASAIHGLNVGNLKVGLNCDMTPHSVLSQLYTLFDLILLGFPESTLWRAGVRLWGLFIQHHIEWKRSREPERGTDGKNSRITAKSHTLNTLFTAGSLPCKFTSMHGSTHFDWGHTNIIRQSVLADLAFKTTIEHTGIGND